MSSSRFVRFSGRRCGSPSSSEELPLSSNSARMARAEANVRRDAAFVDAARLGGNGAARVLAVHVFPNCLPPMMVQASLNLGWAILNAAGLSFIGLGVPIPQPESGAIMATGRDYLMNAAWIAVFPGAMITLAVLGVNLLGDGLRDVLDPRLQ